MAEGGFRAGAPVRLVRLVELVDLEAGPEGGSPFLDPLVDGLKDFRILGPGPFGVQPDGAGEFT